MYQTGTNFGTLKPWIRKEITFPGEISDGARGIKAARVQEWLNLHGVGLVVDDDFGPITTGCVRKFQIRSGLPNTGKVDQATFSALTAPMVAVLQPLANPPGSLSQGIAQYGRLHLAQHPREIGGQNKGPWVRMYMNGNQGASWAWCAGFVSFLMKQSAERLGRSAPIKGSFSCDSLAAQAGEKGLFVKERDAVPDGLPEGSLFLVRRTSTDWTHTGVVTQAETVSFGTIEGNTNDDGSREGYEACERNRGYGSKDFIVF